MSRHGYIQSFWLRKQKPGGWLGCGWCSIFKKDMRVSTEQGRPIFSVPTKSTSCDPRDHHCVDLITDSNSDILVDVHFVGSFFSCIFTSFRPCPMRFSRAELLSLSKPGLDSWELAQFLESAADPQHWAPFLLSFHLTVVLSKNPLLQQEMLKCSPTHGN